MVQMRNDRFQQRWQDQVAQRLFGADLFGAQVIKQMVFGLRQRGFNICCQR